MKIEQELKSISLIQNRQPDEAGKSKKGGSIYAGNLNLAPDLVEEKRRQARQMAMKLVSDAFASDKAIDDDLDARGKHVTELETQNEEYNQIIDNISSEKKALTEGYGIAEDSDEARELELLRKEAGAGKYSTVRLSREEQEQLAQLHKRGLTSYQKQMLTLDAGEREYREKLRDNQMEILQENAIVRGVQIERLKTHEMVDAFKQGDQIMKAASDEIVGMLVEEAKENVDKTMEEEKEKAEEKKEEEEVLEERIEAARAEKRDNTERREKEEEKLLELDSRLDEVRKAGEEAAKEELVKSLDQIVNELVLTTEDLKGIVVDTEL